MKIYTSEIVDKAKRFVGGLSFSMILKCNFFHSHCWCPDLDTIAGKFELSKGDKGVQE